MVLAGRSGDRGKGDSGEGKISLVVVEIRRKRNGELIALGKQWMATTKDSINAVQLKDAILQKSLKWLRDLSKGNISHELEALTLEGLQIVHAQKGSIRCNFVVPTRASDPDGNWHVGAMATLIDDVAATAIYSVVDHVKLSLDFSISFYSTAKIQEEVEIEAKVIGEKGSLTQVVVEVTRKGNRELIALGKQWMASDKKGMKPSQVSSKL
ncbi:Thioesterase superfamily [Gossypium australe]|uniref:Acyl-coenzyme A thioesterase 13 n=1 Tax=Gossypium australe TaxID=47621 RepID=A0A5B6WD31_9ROSI|nr:Thioesterase superfamily [Gossypium australe]